MTTPTPEEAAIEAAYIGEVTRLFGVLVASIAQKLGNPEQAFSNGLAVALSARAVALDALRRSNLRSLA